MSSWTCFTWSENMKLYFSQTFSFSFQLYKGEDTSFQISGLQNNTDYRFRVYVCRRCQDSTQELCGPLSPSSLFHPAAYGAHAPRRAQLPRDPEAQRHVRHGRTLRGSLSRGFRGPVFPHRFCGGILLHEVKIPK